MNQEELFDAWCNEFYNKYSKDESLIGEDFCSISIGFFIAKGLNIDESFKMYDYCIKKGKF